MKRRFRGSIMTKCLDEKTITGVELSEDKEAIRFLIDGGDPIVARCDADCCSHTWIEHVELPALGFPAKVLAIADLDLPGVPDPSEYEVIQVYGLKITTDKGDLIIEYRNSSNGYYGGSLAWPDDSYFYGGVYGQNISNEKWQPLVSDK